VPPSLLFFLPFLLQPKSHWPFWLNFGVGFALMAGGCRDTVSEAWGAAAIAPHFTVFLAAACAPSRSTLRESESRGRSLTDFC
jgi:hypothetical protein